MDKECEKYWKNMADYFFTLAPIVNGPYYAGQMALAARLLDIVIREGGNDEYRNVESEDPSEWSRPENFLPNVNMKNASRFIRKEDKVHFYSHVLYDETGDEMEFPDFRKAIDFCNQHDRPAPNWEELSNLVN